MWPLGILLRNANTNYKHFKNDWDGPSFYSSNSQLKCLNFCDLNTTHELEIGWAAQKIFAVNCFVYFDAQAVVSIFSVLSAPFIKVETNKTPFLIYDCDEQWNGILFDALILHMSDSIATTLPLFT